MVLPADIWRETMVRVHEGIAPKPLPMRRPVEVAPLPELPDTRPAQPDMKDDDIAEQLLLEVLRNILD